MMKFPKEVRDLNPLDGLGSLPSNEDHAIQAVIRTLSTTLPDVNTLTIFDLGIGHLFAQQIWENMGEDSDANASAALHHAVTRDPGSPGLSHFARALLALTLCARWGGSLGPTDQQLRSGLQALVDVVDKDAAFWAEYIGAAAAAVATVVPARPKTAERLRDTVKFQSMTDDSGKSTKISLTLTVNLESTKGVNLQDLEDLFKNVGKTTKNSGDKRRKVKFQIESVSKR